MESSAALPTVPLLTLSRILKAPSEASLRCSYSRYYRHLRRCLAKYPHPLRQPLRAGCSSPCFPAAGAARCFGSPDNQRPREWLLFSAAGSALRGSPPVASPGRLPLASILSSPARPAGAGGGGDGLGVGSGGGGGDGWSSGEGTEKKSLAGESEDVAKWGSDVIILDVGGMSCGGCATSVKRILESLELAEPSIGDAFRLCVEQGAKRVIVSPFFLFPGRHWNQDIPSFNCGGSQGAPWHLLYCHCPTWSS